MKVTEITVTAGRTFNHPHEQYSNLRPEVVLTATLDPGEDPLAAVRDLQRRAEETVEDHKRNVLKALEEEYALGEARTKLIGLARQLKAAQKEMDAIRAEWPEPIQQQLLGESEA